MKILILILICVGYLYPQGNTIPRRVDTLETDVDSLYTKTSHIVNVKEFGAVGDSVTNNTTALQNALNYLHSIGGGTLEIPEGDYIINGLITIPNDGVVTSNHYTMNSIVIKGAGAWMHGSASVTAYPHGGTNLILNYNGDYQILSVGKGYLEISDISFITGSDSGEVIRSIATTLNLHDLAFYGLGKSGTSCTNDAIRLGGYGTTQPQIYDTSAFVGYGTVINNIFFDRIRSGLIFGTYANGVLVNNLTFWNQCGSNRGDMGAITLGDANVDGSNSGNFFSGALIEVANYPHSVVLEKAVGNIFIGYNFFDATSTTQSYFRFNTNAQHNAIYQGYYVGSKPLTSGSDDEYNFVWDNTVGNTSYFPGNLNFSASLRFNGNQNPFWLNPSDNTQYFDALSSFSAQSSLSFGYLDTTDATREVLMTLRRASSTNHTLTINGSDVTMGAAEAGAGLRLYQGSGGTLFLGIGGYWTLTGGVLTSTITTGTAPLIITSTTPVSNLTVERVNDVSFIGEAQTDLDMGGNGLTGINNINLTSVSVDANGLNTRDLYIESGTNLIYAVMGVDSVINGDFTDWTGDNPDSWISSTEDAGNYITENPVGQCQMVTDGTVQAWTFYQSLFSVGVQYGYSFDVISASANDTVVVGVGGNNVQVLTAGSYSGTITASHPNLGVRNNYGAVDFTFDNFRVWGINGAKQPPQIPFSIPLSPWSPATTDTVFIGKEIKSRILDSLCFFDVTDSIGVQMFYRDTSDHNIFTAAQVITSDTTLTNFTIGTIPAGAKGYLYFSYLGDAVAYIRSEIYGVRE